MKRVSERQITKDDYDSSDDVATQDQQQQQGEGEFQRAPPEVIAQRKIVKVRRSNPTQQSSSNPFATVKPPTFGNSQTTASNPFAALANSNTHKPHTLNGDTKKEPADTAQTSNENTKLSDENKEKPSIPQINKQEDTDTENIETKTSDVQTVDIQKEEKKEEKHEEKIEKKDEKPNEVAEDKQNVDKVDEQKSKENTDEKKEEEDITSKKDDDKKEETTKPSTTTDSKKDKENGSINTEVKKQEADTSSRNESKLLFGGITGSTTLKSFASTAAANAGNNNDKQKTFNFGSSSIPIKDSVKENGDGNGHLNKKVELSGNGTSSGKKEEKIDSGEEGEKEIFRNRAKLYVLEGKESNARWKERGVGALKINKNKENGSGRLLMRTEATLRVLLNASLFKEIKMDKATERSVRLQLFDASDMSMSESTTGAGKENEKAIKKPVSKHFLIRFSTKEVVKSFEDTIEEWKKQK